MEGDLLRQIAFFYARNEPFFIFFLLNLKKNEMLIGAFIDNESEQ